MLYANDFRKIALDALRGNWALAVGTGFVALLLGGIGGGGSSSRNSDNSIYQYEVNSPFYQTYLILLSIILIWTIIVFLIGGAVELGYCKFNLNLIRRSEPKFIDLFSKFHLFWKAFGLRFLISTFVFLWSLLFIIPGIIAAYRYSMAFYIMSENPSIGILEAIRESKELMVGNKMRLFSLSLSFIGWIILSIFTLGIGMLWINPYIQAAKTAFYLEISGELPTITKE